MGPIDYLTDKEMQELVHRVGDVILDVNVGIKTVKTLPDKYMTGFFLLQAAHSMLGDALPANAPESKE